MLWRKLPKTLVMMGKTAGAWSSKCSWVLAKSLSGSNLCLFWIAWKKALRWVLWRLTASLAGPASVFFLGLRVAFVYDFDLFR